VLGVRDSGVELQFSVWALREQFLQMRTSMHRDVKRAFEAAGIEVPYPHREVLQRPHASISSSN
jgi:small-conductance mechanosensitive channel